MNFLSSKLKSGAVRLLLAAGVALAAHAPAQADTIVSSANHFSVQIDTSSLSGGGWMAFTLLGGTQAASGVELQIDQFAGSWMDTTERDGDARGTFPQLLLGNGDFYNELRQQASWGGLLSFDLSFSGDYATQIGDIGSTLSIALLAEDQQSWAAGTSGDAVTFALQPMSSTGPAWMSITAQDFVTVTSAVPEPSAAALTALAMLVVALHSRRRISANADARA